MSRPIFYRDIIERGYRFRLLRNHQNIQIQTINKRDKPNRQWSAIVMDWYFKEAPHVGSDNIITLMWADAVAEQLSVNCRSIFNPNPAQYCYYFKFNERLDDKD
ncbi:MAG: hypothetical protein GWO20_00615 [Candidatus Korarchaeota archaeon]|nr:hypothetical protein [Candidatus Korarchaeota archaeon]